MAGVNRQVSDNRPRRLSRWFGWSSWENWANGCLCKQGVATAGAETSKPDRIVTLVHGTGAQHANWLRSSALLSALTKIGGPGKTVIRSFCWSGGNSHSARRVGAIHLRRHLRQVDASVPQFIVAHSHGGNVALHALRNLALRKRVHGLVTLATPFVVARPKPLPRGLLWSGATATLLAVAVWVVWILKRDEGSWWAMPAATTVLATVLTFLFLVVTSAMSYSIGGKGLRKRLGLLGKTRAHGEIARLAFPPMEQNRMLVARPIGDEAGGVLVTSQCLSWVLSRCLSTLAAIGRFTKTNFKRLIVVLMLTMAGSGWILSDTHEGYFKDWMDEHVVSLVMLIPGLGGAALGSVMLLAMLLLLLAAVPFGWDAMVFALHSSTYAEVAPPGHHTVLHVDVGGPGLVHSAIYDDPGTAEEVATWIASEE